MGRQEESVYGVMGTLASLWISVVKLGIAQKFIVVVRRIDFEQNL
jgi:hypothetical protein